MPGMSRRWFCAATILSSFTPAICQAATWQEVDFIYSNKQVIVPGRDKEYAGLNEPKWYGIEVRDTYSFMSEEADRKARLPAGWTKHINGWTDFNVDGWTRDRGKMGFGPITNPDYAYEGTSFSLWSSHSQLMLISPPLRLAPGLYRLSGMLWVGAANGPDVADLWTDWIRWGLGAGPGGRLADPSGQKSDVIGSEDVCWDSTPDEEGFWDFQAGRIWNVCPPSGCPWEQISWNQCLSHGIDGWYEVDMRAPDIPVASWFLRQDTFLVAAAPGDVDQDGDVDLIDFATFQACYTDVSGTPSPDCDVCDFDGDGHVDTDDLTLLQANYTGPITTGPTAEYYVGIVAASDHFYYNGEWTKWGTLIVVDNLKLERQLPGGQWQTVWFEDFETDGDFDGDTDVDLIDFATFQTCYTGEAGTISPEDCAACDLDGDDHVDLDDYAILQANYTGPRRGYGS